MGISLIFSKKKIFQSKHFTKFIKVIKEFRPQKSRIKFIKNLDHKKAASVLLQYCEVKYTLQGVILHICCDLGMWR